VRVIGSSYYLRPAWASEPKAWIASWAGSKKQLKKEKTNTLLYPIIDDVIEYMLINFFSILIRFVENTYNIYIFK